MDESSLGSLVAEVSQGDANAFAKLVKATASSVHRVALRVCADPAEAEDVVQEAYVRAFVALAEGAYDERGQLLPWLRRIAVRVALDGRRGSLRRRDREAAWAYRRGSSNTTEAPVRLGALQAALAELPPKQRIAFVLKEVEGMTTKEVAAAMECSCGAVEQRLVRARSTLRKRFRDE